MLASEPTSQPVGAACNREGSSPEVFVTSSSPCMSGNPNVVAKPEREVSFQERALTVVDLEAEVEPGFRLRTQKFTATDNSK